MSEPEEGGHLTAVVLPTGACEITCDLCGEKYTASAGTAEAIAWASHHSWACPKNESMKDVVEVVEMIPIKFESYSIGGEVADPNKPPGYTPSELAAALDAAGLPVKAGS